MTVNRYIPLSKVSIHKLPSSKLERFILLNAVHDVDFLMKVTAFGELKQNVNRMEKNILYLLRPPYRIDPAIIGKGGIETFIEKEGDPGKIYVHRISNRFAKKLVKYFSNQNT